MMEFSFANILLSQTSCMKSIGQTRAKLALLTSLNQSFPAPTVKTGPLSFILVEELCQLCLRHFICSYFVDMKSKVLFNLYCCCSINVGISF